MVCGLVLHDVRVRDDDGDPEGSGHEERHDPAHHALCLHAGDTLTHAASLPHGTAGASAGADAGAGAGGDNNGWVSECVSVCVCVCE